MQNRPSSAKTDQDGMNGDPESIAIGALSWMAADGALLSRFCALTGIEPDALRAAAGEPGFLAGVLDFLMTHEPTLMRFCDDNDIEPAVVEAAARTLAGGAMPGPGDFV